MNIDNIFIKNLTLNDIQFKKTDLDNVSKYSIGYNLGDLLEMPSLYLSKKTLNFWKKKFHEENEKMTTNEIRKFMINVYPNSILSYYFSSSIPENESLPNKNRLLNAIKTYENIITDTIIHDCIKFIQNKNVLCVHLRCGDTSLENESDKDYDTRQTNYVAEIAKNFKDVIIFTGIIPGYSSTLGYENVRTAAYKHLKSMLEKIPNSRVFLHGSIDDHLSILQYSENVLLHRGGISQILSIICKNRIYIDINNQWWKGKYTEALKKMIKCKELELRND
jgi:hypothetical protein